MRQRDVVSMRLLVLVLLVLLVVPACRTTPLDNIWPGCCPPAPGARPACPAGPVPRADGRSAQQLPWSVEIDERISPAVDCNPVRTQHTLVVTVRDQCGNPMPGQRVEWILSRYPQAVGDIVAVDDQYGCGRIAPLATAVAGQQRQQDRQPVRRLGHELRRRDDRRREQPPLRRQQRRAPAGHHRRPGSVLAHDHLDARGRHGPHRRTSPRIRDGTKHKIWAKKIWADFDVEFPPSAVNTLPNAEHAFPVRVFRSDGSGIPGQTVDAEILDGPGVVFESSNQPTTSLMTDANGVAEFLVRNTSGETGVNRIRFTAQRRVLRRDLPALRHRHEAVAAGRARGRVPVPGRPGSRRQPALRQADHRHQHGDAPAETVMLDDQPDAGLRFADGALLPDGPRHRSRRARP